MKIAFQLLPSSPALNFCAVRDLCGEFLCPFRITHLQIPLPATPLISHPSKSLGGVLILASRFSPCAQCLAVLRRASVASPFFPATCRLLCISLPSFPSSLPVFSIVCSLFSQNIRGGGTCGTAISGCPPTTSPRSSIATKVGPMTSKPAFLVKPSLGSRHLHLRAPIPFPPKWSIIPAPVSAVRLRGRSV